MRVNRQIRSDTLRVIDEEGGQLGVLSLREALAKAEAAGLDLVEVAPNAKPPVAKIIDYGKFRYLQTKKEKESRKAQHQAKVKEVKLKPNIDEHDFQTKLKRAREFVLKGDKVRISCMFRGREMLHMELGENLLRKFCEQISDVASVEAPQKRMGRTIVVVIAPLGKKAKVLTKNT